MAKGTLYGIVSLVSGSAAIVIFLFLAVFGIKAMEINSVVILALLAVVLFPIAYFTNKAGKRLRQQSR